MIGSVLKALDVMELFSSNGPRLTLGEIATQLGYPKSTAHNILRTLAYRGYVEHTDDGRYALGTAIIPLTQAVRMNVELRDRAAPLLRELANLTHESVYLAVLDGDRILYIYAVESPQRLLARTAVGDRAHLHCTALGKAVLAKLLDARGKDILEHLELPQYTDNTITDPDTLEAELMEINRLGYARDWEEHEPNTYCVGAAIVDAQEQVLGACSMSGDNAEAILNFAEQVMRTALEISRRMGYVPRRPSMIMAERAPTRERGRPDGG